MASLSMIPQIHCKTNPNNRVFSNVLETEQSNHNNNNVNVGKKVRIKILDGCKVWISNYRFDYNGEGGRGLSNRINVADKRRELIDVVQDPAPLRFEADMKTIHIPPVTTATTTINGWAPFPHFVKVDIVPEALQGKIYQECGKVELKLKAKIWVSIGSRHKAPPLIVDTVLTSEGALKGAATRGTGGKRLGKDGRCKLVGVANVNAVEDHYLNSVLSLPSQCIASLNAIIYFV